jgi:hypothetical protein
MSFSSHIVYVESPDQHSRGTGAFVGPDLVLTALHVIWPHYETAAPPIGPVRVRVGESEQPNASLYWPPVDAIRTHPVDAALVKLDEGQPRREALLELDDGWPIDAEFRAEGYPESISIGKATIGGQLCDHGGHQHLGRLSCTKRHLPDRAQGWAGVSGGPVIVAGRIRGVLKSLERNWTNALDATLVSAIRSAPGFAALRFAPNPFDQLLRAGLNEVPELYTDLRTHAQLADNAAVVPWMLSASCVEVLGALDRFHELACRAPSSKPDTTKAGVLRSLALSVFAAHSPSLETDQSGLRVIENVSNSTAPLALAKLHGLPVRFVAPANLLDRPAGPGVVPAPPDKSFGMKIHESARSHIGASTKLSNPTDEQIGAFISGLLDLARIAPDSVDLPYLEVTPELRKDPTLAASLATLLASIPELCVFDRRKAGGAFEVQPMLRVNRILIRHAKAFPA